MPQSPNPLPPDAGATRTDVCPVVIHHDRRTEESIPPFHPTDLNSSGHRLHHSQRERKRRAEECGLSHLCGITTF